MTILWILFMLSIFALLIFYNRKGIRTIKVMNIDLIYLVAGVFFILYFIFFHLLPMNTYYIKAKDYSSEKVYSLTNFSTTPLMIDRIIEDEMDRANISYDQGSLRIMGAFEGKTQLIYMTRCKGKTEEEVRVFEFERNIFGNLKPLRDFKTLETIDESQEDSVYGLVINDGFPQFLLNYGFQNYNPDIVGISPEGYFFYSERIDRWRVSDFFTIGLILFLILYLKEEKTYTKVIISGDRVNIVEIKYLVKDKFKH